jgi:hypothetical protein
MRVLNASAGLEVLRNACVETSLHAGAGVYREVELRNEDERHRPDLSDDRREDDCSTYCAVLERTVRARLSAGADCGRFVEGDRKAGLLKAEKVPARAHLDSW